MIADDAFTAANVETEIMPDRSDFIKKHSMEASVAFDPNGIRTTKFHTFYGPNQYKVLKSYDRDLDGDDKLRLQHIIPMGWSLFRWISTCVIIPVFNFLSKYIASYGIIILLLTIIIKLVILPFTFKSYMSSAKMRVLRPQIDEINARIPAEKAMERQQATMNLYQKAGVSPMSGCLPMLFQMPILFAMFSFFPTAFELRGQSFLWADDLSSYDAILSWDMYIPLITPFFGNHISLFCLLMTVTNIIYTKINMAHTGAADQPGAGMMKWMMYLMPIMFMFMYNNYASGLSYYYFVSLLIRIIQTYLYRLFVDDKKVLAQLEKNKAKPQKKSAFMQRLEEAQKAQQQALREQQARQMKSNSKGRH
jgi:YidC/Oxa1 family membrane protein insertase